jgi:hypothetical protein
MQQSKSIEVKKRRVARGQKVTSTRALAYAILSGVGGMSKQAARKRCGYAPTYSAIEKTKSFLPIQERIEAACEVVGVSVEANAAVLGEIAYNRDNACPERVGAIREINNMAGWRAPERVEVQQHTTNVSILIDMVRNKGVSMGELIRQAQST